MPLVASMGGTVGEQSSALTIKGLANNSLTGTTLSKFVLLRSGNSIPTAVYESGAAHPVAKTQSPELGSRCWVQH